MIQYRSTIASPNFKKFPDLADFVPNAVVRKRQLRHSYIIAYTYREAIE